MKLFISWSGELSGKVAVLIKSWLLSVFTTAEAFVSSEDISKGAVWTVELSKALKESDFGIICLVPDNVHQPWLNFEAGAIAKALENSRVSPFLFGLQPSQIDGPLKTFQCTTYTKDDVRKLVHSINKTGNSSIPEARLDKIFEQWWPSLEKELDILKFSDLLTARGQIRYLKGRNDIYQHALQLLNLAELRVRVVQFFGGPRPPDTYAENAARILKAKRDRGVDVIYDVYLVVAPSRLPADFDDLNEKRLGIYAAHDVRDLIRVSLLRMEYPASFGFDMFIVDQKHAHISFTTSELVPGLQRGITFENDIQVVSDLVEWFGRSIERNSQEYTKSQKAAAP
jgi:hypothetical protein